MKMKKGKKKEKGKRKRKRKGKGERKGEKKMYSARCVLQRIRREGGSVPSPLQGLQEDLYM